jgi:hypothetical protein
MIGPSRPAFQDEERALEASEWYVRLESEDGISGVEIREWEEWAANPANTARFDEFIRVHRRVASLPRPGLPSAEEIRADSVLPRTSLWSFWLAGSKERCNHWVWQYGVATACGGGLILLALFGGLFSFGQHAMESSAIATTSANVEQGLPFSESALERLRASGRPVFVNLRASWCPTCTTNERTVLARNPVRQMMARKQVAYLTGDWSLQDPAISAELRRFGRGGVPLYLLFSPGSTEPLIFSQVLTEHGVLRELARLPDPRASSL